MAQFGASQGYTLFITHTYQNMEPQIYKKKEAIRQISCVGEEFFEFSMLVP